MSSSLSVETRSSSSLMNLPHSTGRHLWSDTVIDKKYSLDDMSYFVLHM